MGNRNLVACPKCHKTFDVSYARVFACKTCPSVVHCQMIKCPFCENEFTA